MGGTDAACWKIISHKLLLWVQPCTCARHSPEKVERGTGCYLKMEALLHFSQCPPQSHSSVCSCTLGKACEIFFFFREFCWVILFFCTAHCSSLCMRVRSFCSLMNLTHWQFRQAVFQNALSTSSALEMCTLPADCLLHVSLVNWIDQSNGRKTVGEQSYTVPWRWTQWLNRERFISSTWSIHKFFVNRLKAEDIFLLLFVCLLYSLTAVISEAAFQTVASGCLMSMSLLLPSLPPWWAVAQLECDPPDWPVCYLPAEPGIGSVNRKIRVPGTVVKKCSFQAI